MRLDKFMTDLGIGSRSAVKELIKKGRIKKNGVIVKRPEEQVLETDEVLFDDSVLSLPALEYYLMNKPSGVLTAMKDPRLPTVAALLPTKRKDVKPVGRLDMDTSGVLIFTNDGELTHRLLSPKNGVLKVYEAELEKDLPENAEELLKEPVCYGKIRYRVPEAFERTGKRSAVLTVSEGRFHEVKRIFEAIGCPVVKLKRLSFAGLTAEGLPEGECRKLTEEECALLRKAAGMKQE